MLFSKVICFTFHQVCPAMRTKTPSQHWTDCFCSLLSYSNLFKRYIRAFPILFRHLFEYLTACQMIRKKSAFYSQENGLSLPTFVGHKISQQIHSQHEVRQPYLYFKCGEGVFCILWISGEHWFRLWLGAARQQAINWASVDQDACHNMASLMERVDVVLCVNVQSKIISGKSISFEKNNWWRCDQNSTSMHIVLQIQPTTIGTRAVLKMNHNIVPARVSSIVYILHSH